MPMEKKARQRIQFLRTPDGVQLAWAEAGTGPTLIKAPNWLSHLEYEWESPVWRHWIRFFSDHFRLVRYDERGCGMSDWNVGDVSFSHWVDDLESVADAALPQGAFPLFGVSQGVATSIAYAVKHPERVSRLILYGGYALGWALRGDPVGKREYEAVVALVALGWGKDNPAFRQVFTSRFIPGASRWSGSTSSAAGPAHPPSRPSCCRNAPKSTSRSWWRKCAPRRWSSTLARTS
jgi:pimeloyl-ACP methyl ester carboxylesterase